MILKNRYDLNTEIKSNSKILSSKLVLHLLVNTLLFFCIAFNYLRNFHIYWKWKWKSLSCVQVFVIPWTIQSMEFSRPGVGSCSLIQGSSQTRNRIEVSCIAGRFFFNWAIREALTIYINLCNTFNNIHV